MKLTVAAKSPNEAFARSVVAAFCAPLNPTVDEVNDIKTAVSEAVTNCIVHAYKDTDNGEILIEVTLQGEVVHIAVADRGIGIKDIAKARQPFFTTGNDERSGMGFTVMETFMDTLDVVPNEGGGLLVKMSKAINNRSR